MMTGRAATLIYLHGFNSSPQAAKAKAVLRYLQKNSFAAHFVVPWVPPQPLQAMDYLLNLLEELGPQQVRLIGSSLGGFYAAYLSQQFGVPSVLINPVVRPDELMSHYLGEHQNPYSGESYCLNAQHMGEFRDLNVEHLTEPEKILLMVQKGDETLDYRRAVAQYNASAQIVEEGGDHHFQGFERHLPHILEFLDLNHMSSQESQTRKIS